MERISLNNLLNTSNWVDNTDEIRALKHSRLVRRDVQRMQELKTTGGTVDTATLMEECPLLFANYTEIFNKLKRDELDYNIMYSLLNVWQEIEDGTVDAYNGAVKFGTLMRDIYYNSVEKQMEKNGVDEPVVSKSKPISWKEYKLRKP